MPSSVRRQLDALRAQSGLHLRSNSGLAMLRGVVVPIRSLVSWREAGRQHDAAHLFSCLRRLLEPDVGQGRLPARQVMIIIRGKDDGPLWIALTIGSRHLHQIAAV